ncbi:MAG: site-specific integrase [Ignavibacteria bacterium]|nr:site-specific integrase [Ignavibacteria bacterium]
MAVIKRGKSFWIDIGFNHRRYRKRSPLNTCRGAKAYEVVIRQKLASGKPLEESEPVTPPIFRDIALKWFDVNVKNNNKPSEIQIRSYLLNRRIIPFFGKKIINKITTYDIEEFKSQLIQDEKLSAKTVNNNLSILSCCFKAALEWEIIEHIPRIKLLKVPPQTFDFLSETELQQLLSSASGLWYDMILTAARTGMRIGELIALKAEDIDFEKRLLTVQRNNVRGFEGTPKNNRTRIIPLIESVYQVLRQRSGKDSYIFCKADGDVLKYNYCLNNLIRLCKKAGLRRIGWHDLRHTFASHLEANGATILTIKDLLGHSDIKMTMRYTHVNLSSLNKAMQTLEPAFNLNGTLTAQMQDKVVS